MRVKVKVSLLNRAQPHLLDIKIALMSIIKNQTNQSIRKPQWKKFLKFKLTSTIIIKFMMNLIPNHPKIMLNKWITRHLQRKNHFLWRLINLLIHSKDKLLDSSKMCHKLINTLINWSKRLTWDKAIHFNRIIKNLTRRNWNKPLS
jgi:hypothetical protein